MGNQGKQQDRKLTTFEKQRQALSLKAAGKSYDAIAAELGYADRSGAFRSVQAAMSKIRREGVQEMRTLEDARLDLLLEAIWTRATSGNVPAIRAALSVMERRARLLGLDAPSKLELGRLLESEDWLRIVGLIRGALTDWPEAQDAVEQVLRADNE